MGALIPVDYFVNNLEFGTLPLLWRLYRWSLMEILKPLLLPPAAAVV